MIVALDIVIPIVLLILLIPNFQTLKSTLTIHQYKILITCPFMIECLLMIECLESKVCLECLVCLK